MGKASRDKGKRGEREVVALDLEAGFVSKRTAPLQAAYSDEWADVECGTYPLSILRREVKFYEKVPLGRFVAEYLEGKDAAPGEVNALVTKSNGQDWYVTLNYREFLKMLAAWREARAENARREGPL